jgi:hypothetical protein
MIISTFHLRNLLHETQKTIEVNGELIQKLEPIYMDSEYKFVKSHFYSPTKNIFGLHVGTFAINVLVIWTMTLILYLFLYFRVLKKTLSSGEKLFKKRPKITD